MQTKITLLHFQSGDYIIANRVSIHMFLHSANRLSDTATWCDDTAHNHSATHFATEHRGTHSDKITNDCNPNFKHGNDGAIIYTSLYCSKWNVWHFVLATGKVWWILHRQMSGTYQGHRNLALPNWWQIWSWRSVDYMPPYVDWSNAWNGVEYKNNR